MHEGHRGRMVSKLTAESSLLSDHELLEILLYNALPRVNTNPLSHRLIDAFGSLEGVLCAAPEELAQVQGMGGQVSAFLVCVGEILSRVVEKHVPLPSVFEEKSFCEYLKRRFEPITYEVLDCIFLNEDGKILCKRSFTSKRLHEAEIAPSEFSKAIVNNPCSALVLAHNHPSGDCRPSETDDKLTKQCELLCSINNVRLFDHFIYAKNGIYSYYQQGEMKKIAYDFHVKTVLKENGK